MHEHQAEIKSTKTEKSPKRPVDLRQNVWKQKAQVARFLEADMTQSLKTRPKSLSCDPDGEPIGGRKNLMLKSGNNSLSLREDFWKNFERENLKVTPKNSIKVIRKRPASITKNHRGKNEFVKKQEFFEKLISKGEANFEITHKLKNINLPVTNPHVKAITPGCPDAETNRGAVDELTRLSSQSKQIT